MLLSQAGTNLTHTDNLHNIRRPQATFLTCNTCAAAPLSPNQITSMGFRISGRPPRLHRPHRFPRGDRGNLACLQSSRRSTKTLAAVCRFATLQVLVQAPDLAAIQYAIAVRIPRPWVDFQTLAPNMQRRSTGLT